MRMEYITAEQFFNRKLLVPEQKIVTNLTDEIYLEHWSKPVDMSVVDFLASQFHLPAKLIPWENSQSIGLSLIQSLAGKLPVINVDSHEDFCFMTALLNGRLRPEPFPLTVNAVAMQLRAKPVYKDRVIILNNAPYSNVPAEQLGLEDKEWLGKSLIIRTRHECVHYECLRFFGSMQNNVLDEILADCFGQLAAFGSFSAARQRLFFGIAQDAPGCTGRLNYYLQKVEPLEQAQVITKVNAVLTDLETYLLEAAEQQLTEIDLLWDVTAFLQNKLNT